MRIVALKETDGIKDDDLEFEALVREFTTDISAAEYTNFDENVQASEPMINEFEIDWRQRVREDSINAIQNLEIVSDLGQEISDDDDRVMTSLNKKAWVSQRFYNT